MNDAGLRLQDYEESVNDAGLRPPSPTGRPRSSTAAGCSCSSQGASRCGLNGVDHPPGSCPSITSGPTAGSDERQAESGIITTRGHHTAGGGGEAPGREHSCITGQWKSTGVCTPYPASYLGTQELLGLEKEESTPEERYLVSGARIRIYVFSPEVDLKAFDEMSFQDQLQHARQQESLRTATQSKTQVGVRDPFSGPQLRPLEGRGSRTQGVPGSQGRSPGITGDTSSAGIQDPWSTRRSPGRTGETSSAGTQDQHTPKSEARQPLADATP